MSFLTSLSALGALSRKGKTPSNATVSLPSAQHYLRTNNAALTSSQPCPTQTCDADDCMKDPTSKIYMAHLSSAVYEPDEATATAKWAALKTATTAFKGTNDEVHPSYLRWSVVDALQEYTVSQHPYKLHRAQIQLQSLVHAEWYDKFEVASSEGTDSVHTFMEDFPKASIRPPVKALIDAHRQKILSRAAK